MSFLDSPLRSISHFPSSSFQQKIEINEFMFVEDCHLGVMPIGGRSTEHPDFCVDLRGNNEDNSAAIEIVASIGRYNVRHSPEVLVSDSVNAVAHAVSAHSAAAFEIIQSGEGNISLHSFPVVRLLRIPGYFVQWVPKEDYRHFHKHFAFIPATDVWRVRIPPTLGGTRGHKRLLKRLRRYGAIGPKFLQHQIETGKHDLGYDFQAYTKANTAYVVRSARRWGWNRRDLLDDISTQFFSIYQAVTMNWARAILREHIIRRLNQLLQSLRIETEISVSGLPTPSAILGVRRDLVKGALTFDEALEKTRVF